jgi:hypothetical protein
VQHLLNRRNQDYPEVRNLKNKGRRKTCQEQALGLEKKNIPLYEEELMT